MTPPALLLDIDGVLVVSWKPVPGAVEAMRAIRDAGLRIRFLTNTTSRTRESIATALRDVGIGVDDDELVTAGVASAAYLRQHHPGARCFVLNDGPLDDLGDVTVVGPDERPDVVVIGSAGPSFSWDAVNRAARAVMNGAALVAMHGSATWRTDAGICVDGGAYVAALERATGREATVIGKPAPAMFEAALAALDAAPTDGVMVGDDLHNDVLAARALGLRGVLVRTGKYRNDQLERSPEQPDAVIDSIADLPAWLGIESDGTTRASQR
jgi:HAD superfamily hydrolase (TIGR01458 family)